MELVRHPASPASAITGVTVHCERDGRDLRLRYNARGAIDRLQVEADAPERTDGLWRHTCFEMFVTGGAAEYREYNFAPSGAWAAYVFAGYRNGMRDADAQPVIAWDAGELIVQVAVPIAGDWQLNLSAVIEETDGTKSYWALAHPDGPPDFHDPACFVLTLPAAG